MRSSSKASRKGDEPGHSATLREIARWIEPLHPPVADFEKKARQTPFRTLISVLLSARTQDATTDAAAERLFSAAATPKKILALGENRIARLIYPVGFYRQKAKSIMAICRRLPRTGDVPGEFHALTSLPGVGRKTANLVLAVAFGKPAIAVDTHVFRISCRLGWAKGATPAEVEAELQRLFPRKDWWLVNQTLVGFGQTVCRPVHPRCDRCFLPPRCPHFQENHQG